MRNLLLPAAAIACALVAAPALAHGYKIGALQIGHPWSRATPGGAKTGAGYLTVTNTGKTADTLLGGSTTAADKLEIHQMSMAGGVMTMRPVTGGVAIAPGATVEFKPGGYHFMLIGLKAPLKAGDRVPATLTFAKAGKVQVEFTVEAMGATQPSQDHGQMDHSHMEMK